jgi:hypothetical protein
MMDDEKEESCVAVAALQKTGLLLHMMDLSGFWANGSLPGSAARISFRVIMGGANKLWLGYNEELNRK